MIGTQIDFNIDLWIFLTLQWIGLDPTTKFLDLNEREFD